MSSLWGSKCLKKEMYRADRTAEDFTAVSAPTRSREEGKHGAEQLRRSETTSLIMITRSFLMGGHGPDLLSN